MACEGDVACIAKGGKGGRGNRRFASPTNRTPTEFEPGIPSCERWLKLELKLIADVGIVGLPNAGKSTLLSKLSRAKPKIAEYPFTTLQPHLGIAELSGHRRLILADMPGLIEGAHTGIGLGDERSLRNKSVYIPDSLFDRSLQLHCRSMLIHAPLQRCVPERYDERHDTEADKASVPYNFPDV